MIKEITIKIYNFEDLSKDAQEKAIEDHRNFTAEVATLDYMVEELTEDLKEEGLYSPKIYYSGFHSQGDGACFEFCNIDFEKFLTKNKIKTKFNLLIKRQDNITFRAAHSGYHYHENCINTFKEINRYLDCHDSHYQRSFNALEDQLIDFQEWFEWWRVEKCKEIYKKLNDEYDFLLSDECLKENIIINEYEFNEKGEII